MYFYYFLASMGYRGLVALVRPLHHGDTDPSDVGGIVVTYTAAVEHSAGGKRHATRTARTETRPGNVRRLLSALQQALLREVLVKRRRKCCAHGM